MPAAGVRRLEQWDLRWSESGDRLVRHRVEDLLLLEPTRRGAPGLSAWGVGARLLRRPPSVRAAPLALGHLPAHDLDMKSGVHPTYKTKYDVGHWPEYDRALVQRGDVTLWLSAAAIDGWQPEASGRPGGQRRFSDAAIETALTP
ncbi:MAG: transposase [Acidobacteria bacterium]|nr:transposase [Acidobacteriota bacterium]